MDFLALRAFFNKIENHKFDTDIQPFYYAALKELDKMCPAGYCQNEWHKRWIDARTHELMCECGRQPLLEMKENGSIKIGYEIGGEDDRKA